MDQDVSCSFEYLSRKTAGVFNNLKNNGFNMYYRGKIFKLLYNNNLKDNKGEDGPTCECVQGRNSIRFIFFTLVSKIKLTPLDKKDLNCI